MTPYSRRMIAAAGIAATIAATGYATHPGDGSAAPAAVERIAPGGNIRSVVNATARYGWPHMPTRPERRDVAALVVHTYTPANAHGGSSCLFDAYLGRVRCVLQVDRRIYRVTVRVFEDGSYRIGRRAGA